MIALRHFCLSLLLAVGVALGVSAVYLMLVPTAVSSMASALTAHPYALTVLVLPALASVLFLVTFVFPGGSRSCLTFNTENGKVEVRLSAAEHYVRKIASEFPEIKSLHPDLRARRGILSIDLQLGIHAGSSIPDLSRRVQRRVREVLDKDLGLGTEPIIKVTVREISGKPQASADISPPPETGPEMTREDVD